LITFFEQSPDYRRSASGLESDTYVLTYANIFQDVRDAIDRIHYDGSLKERTLMDVAKYVDKDPRLPQLLHRLHVANRKCMLITNSGYDYTQRLMTYLFDFPHGGESNLPHKPWTEYFDVVIVDAKKPQFFAEGSVLREVDVATGGLKIGSARADFRKGIIYSGGSSDALLRAISAHGDEILYVGDHIFGDILKSRKEQGLRTFLVIPELNREMSCWRSVTDLYEHVRNLEWMRAECFRGLDSSNLSIPDIVPVERELRSSIQALDDAYNKYFGSMFRTGSRQTFFAMQAKRYADLYASHFGNLLSYPFFYHFRTAEYRMPHEEIILHGGERRQHRLARFTLSGTGATAVEDEEDE
jgi:5'-nucleotidase